MERSQTSSGTTQRPHIRSKLHKVAGQQRKLMCHLTTHDTHFNPIKDALGGPPVTPSRTPLSENLGLRIGPPKSLKKDLAPSLEQLRRLNRNDGTWWSMVLKSWNPKESAASVFVFCGSDSHCHCAFFTNQANAGKSSYNLLLVPSI